MFLLFKRFSTPLAATWLCWGIIGLSPIVGKYAVGVISPVLLVFLGTLVAICYFAPWVSKNKKWEELFSPQTRWQFLFIGTFGTALPFSILLWALHYTTPGNAAILQQSELLYSLLFAAVFLREFPSRKQLFGSALIVAGVVIILLKEQYSPRWMGDLMVVGCTWMLQAGSTLAKKLPAHLDHRLIAMARNLYALPVLILLLVIMAYTQGLVFKPTVQTLAVLTYTGVLKYGLAMVLWYRAIRALDLSKVTAIYLSYPALSFIFSVLLGFDKGTPYQLLGLGVSLTGAYLVSLSTKK